MRVRIRGEDAIPAAVEQGEQADEGEHGVDDGRVRVRVRVRVRSMDVCRHTMRHHYSPEPATPRTMPRPYASPRPGCT